MPMHRLYTRAPAYRHLKFKKSSQFLLESHQPVTAVTCGRHTSSCHEYLHHSTVPTDHFQRSLPRLPIPTLGKTCERYLDSQKVILSEQEFKGTQAITSEFLQTDGKRWHDELLKFDKANKHTSYITDFWFDMYLKDRRPVVFNHNPFMSFTPLPDPGYNNVLVKATNTIVSSMRFMKTLRANVLSPEVFHLDPKKSDTESFRNFVRRLPPIVSYYGAYWYQAYPLDMSQFPSLFNSTRIPRKDKDELWKDTEARHMLVMRNGNFFVFDALDAGGNIAKPEVIMANLQAIMDDKSSQPKHALGFLTTAPRDTWAEARQELLNSGNAEAIRLIDSALFCLCLDDTAPGKETPELAKTFLHGDGANRWFDKSFSVLMTADGEASINFEHSWGDGVAVLRYFNEVWNDTMLNPSVSPMSIPQPGGAQIRKLEFTLTGPVKETIDQAKSDFEAKAKSLDLQMFGSPSLSKGFAKANKLSPDSLMQFIIQLAYWKQTNGGVAATYESCSTSAFKHGRTETVRSATAQTKAACEILSRSGVGRQEAMLALQACSKTHGELTKNAAMGQGFDRHLMAMKLLAQQAGELPTFYKDQAYTKLNHIILSTSTLSSPACNGGGFGAVVPDGYGVGYSIDDNRCGCVVTAYPGKDLTDFIQCLQDSVEQVAQILR